MKMKAAIVEKVRAPLVVDEVELDDPHEGEVQVKIVASGVCHSCLHAADGSWSEIPVPIVLGDEGAGIVTKVGRGVTDLKEGDHAILSWAPSCGQCHYCVTGRPVHCEVRADQPARLADGTTRMKWRGETLYRFGTVASHSEYTTIPSSSAIKIRDDVPLTTVALIGCSVMTGVGAVLNTAQVPAGATVAIWGAGGIGLNVVQGAALAAAGHNNWGMAGAIGFENIASGIGGVTVIAYFSALCDLRFTASQYALISAAASIVGRFVTGTTAGGLIEAMGYVNFYLLTTIIAFPGIILFWLMMRSGLVDASVGSAGKEETGAV